MNQEQDYREVDMRFESILREIIQQVSGPACNGNDKVSLALLLFLLREANTWWSIRLLRQYTPTGFHTAFMVDAGILLRAMFDAYLQADLIYRDPAKRIELAALYLDFEHVERHKMQSKILAHDNPLTNGLQHSQYKAEGELRVEQEFERVKAQFMDDKQQGGTTRRSSRTRDKWYKGDMSQLARAAGREAEYDTFMASFSGCVHSSAFAVRHGPMVPAAHIVFLASTFTARVAAMNADYNRLDIGADRIILQEFCKSWLDEE